MRYTVKQWIRNIVGLKNIHQSILAEAAFIPGNKVLDVGCGTGMLLEEIYKTHGNTLEYMGIEPDESVRLIAERKHADKGIKFKRAFASHLPSVQDYYSHVICMVSFHHFPKEEWRQSLVELKRVLAPHGKLIIVEFGMPRNILGYLINLFNPCARLAKGLEAYLVTEAAAQGLRLEQQSIQFGYIIHQVYTK